MLENKFLWFKPLILWYFVKAAPANNTANINKSYYVAHVSAVHFFCARLAQLVLIILAHMSAVAQQEEAG